MIPNYERIDESLAYLLKYFNSETTLNDINLILSICKGEEE